VRRRPECQKRWPNFTPKNCSLIVAGGERRAGKAGQYGGEARQPEKFGPVGGPCRRS
jgi:hypothetical protein